jgi:AcrR family transcriptional regulator
MMDFDDNLKRKSPRQQRAKMTVLALEQAFVRVLMLHGDFQKIRVREVVELAGVGIGTFYDYFRNLQDLAASAMRTRRDQLIDALRQTILEQAQAPLPTLIDAMLDDGVDAALKQPKEWAALLLIERQVDDLRGFQAFHQGLQQTWAEALTRRCPHLSAQQIGAMAAMVHAITYGWCAQEILVFRGERTRQASRHELGLAVQAYLSAMLGDTRLC